MAEPHEAQRPQAGPLPSKQGEIGYREDVHGAAHEAGSSNEESADELPTRHPADTPLSSVPNTSTELVPPASTDSSSTPSNGAEATQRSPSPSSTHSTSKLVSLWNSKRVPTFHGLRATTLGLLVLQVLTLAGTITGWVFLIQHMQASGGDQSNDANFSMGSALIFVYVAFAIMTLVQIIFIERCLYRLRAERYAFLHPGEVLPRHRRGRPPHPALAFAPWHRQSLPSYAATLAQSGVGTGDVEDNVIAVPPPPSYGERHASMLLLAGEIPERLRRIRDSASSSSSLSWVEIRQTRQDGPDSRPVSYMSRDPDWEERLDADAAAHLEENLAKMEEGDVTDAAHTWHAPN